MKFKFDPAALKKLNSFLEQSPARAKKIAEAAIKEAFHCGLSDEGWSQSHGYGIPLYLPTPAPDTKFMGVAFEQGASGLWLPASMPAKDFTLTTANAVYGPSPMYAMKELQVAIQKFKESEPVPKSLIGFPVVPMTAVPLSSLSPEALDAMFAPHLKFEDTLDMQPLEIGGNWPPGVPAAQISLSDILNLHKAFSLPTQLQPEFYDAHEPEQDILRAFHGSRDEYVWSDTLQAHVRIGKSLRARNPT